MDIFDWFFQLFPYEKLGGQQPSRWTRRDTRLILICALIGALAGWAYAKITDIVVPRSAWEQIDCWKENAMTFVDYDFDELIIKTDKQELKKVVLPGGERNFQSPQCFTSSKNIVLSKDLLSGGCKPIFWVTRLGDNFIDRASINKCGQQITHREYGIWSDGTLWYLTHETSYRGLPVFSIVVPSLLIGLVTGYVISYASRLDDEAFKLFILALIIILIVLCGISICALFS